MRLSTDRQISYLINGLTPNLCCDPPAARPAARPPLGSDLRDGMSLTNCQLGGDGDCNSAEVSLIGGFVMTMQMVSLSDRSADSFAQLEESPSATMEAVADGMLVHGVNGGRVRSRSGWDTATVWVAAARCRGLMGSMAACPGQGQIVGLAEGWRSDPGHEATIEAA